MDYTIFTDNKIKAIDMLPEGLEELQLYGMFNHSIDYLPNSLEFLVLDSYFDQEINNLPNNLNCLILGDTYQQKIKYLPKKLKTLCLPCYEHDLMDIKHDPNNPYLLEELTLKKYDFSLKHILKIFPNLKTLRVYKKNPNIFSLRGTIKTFSHELPVSGVEIKWYS